MIKKDGLNVKEATPNSDPHNTTNNIPYEIKKLVAEKRKARATWQRTHTPDSRKIYNQKNNKLKSKHQEMRTESFKAYVSSLKTDDNTNWKPIKHKKKTHGITTSDTQKLNISRNLGKK
jgi:hypothetical protein